MGLQKQVMTTITKRDGHAIITAQVHYTMTADVLPLVTKDYTVTEIEDDVNDKLRAAIAKDAKSYNLPQVAGDVIYRDSKHKTVSVKLHPEYGGATWDKIPMGIWHLISKE